MKHALTVLHKLTGLISISAVSFFYLILPACRPATPPATAPLPDTPIVQTFSLTKGQLSTSMQLPGELRPYQAVDLYAKVNGFVKQVYVDLGSQVHKGQLLLTLEAPELQSAASAAYSAMHTKQAVYSGSRANYYRLYQTSLTPGTIAANDLELAQARMSADSTDLLAARAAYQEATAMNGYLEIRAPFDGVISERNVHPGAYATGGNGTPLLRLEQQDHLRLTVAVSEAATAYFRQMDTVQFTVKSLPAQHFTAHVNRMAGSLSTPLRTETLEMDVWNKDGKLLPGMYAQVLLHPDDNQDSFVIPRQALVTNAQGSFVIRVAHNITDWVNVRKMQENADSIAISGSLQPGDRLVTAAADTLKNGITVLLN